MNAKEIAEYLRTWAKIHAQEVYGSPADYINIHSLLNQLDRIEKTAEERY